MASTLPLSTARGVLPLHPKLSHASSWSKVYPGPVFVPAYSCPWRHFAKRRPSKPSFPTIVSASTASKKQTKLEQPPNMSTLETFLSVQTALNAVTKGGRGHQLGWVIFRPEQLDDYPNLRADWEACCEQQCQDLGLEFQDLRDTLGWTASLAQAIEQGQSSFCYGAAHHFLEHDKMHAKLLLQPTRKSRKEDEERGITTSLTDLDMDLILSCCSPAPYGDLLTESTKLDPQVRRALEADCDVQLDYEYQPRDPYYSYRRQEESFPRPIFEHCLKEAVKCHLSHGQNVRLVPYKLNVYGEGDFFQPHTDTPVNAELFIGTIVVCLASKFAGGELVVSHGGTCQTFDFAAKSGEPGVYQFATFYGDCLHEIKPVTMGQRVTLTYHVLRNLGDEWEEDQESGAEWPYEDGKIEETPVPTGSAIPEKLKDELKKELVALSAWDYPHVGFLLQHEYTMSGLVPEGLKGSDKLLYDLILEAGWSVRFFPVLVVAEASQYVGDCDDRLGMEYNSFTRKVYSFTKKDFKYLNGEGRDKKPDHGFHTDIPFMRYGGNPAGRVLDRYSTFGGFQGNHAEPSMEQTIYLQSAMIVDLR